MKVMSAIERCRTAALGGHVGRCENETCAHTVIAYNSCRNRHCPKCQGAAAKEWLAAREAELLPVPYYHVVFTLPAAIADIAYQNKAIIYDLLFKASAETLVTIAADPKHLGARVGVLSVLHSWGSALTHHPHVHMIVPGGGISLDGTKWLSCRPGFFLPVRVLSRLFRRLFLDKLVAAHQAGQLQFFGTHASLIDAQAFAAYLAPLRNAQWVVYSKRPFGGPKEVLRYLARYTHRVAISNSRLIALDDNGVTFKRQRRDVAGGTVGSRSDPGELCARYPDAGAAHLVAHAQATGSREGEPHPSGAKDAGRRQHQIGIGDHGRDGHERPGDDRGAHRGRERSRQAGQPRQLSVEDITGETARGSSRARDQAPSFPAAPSSQSDRRSRRRHRHDRPTSGGRHRALSSRSRTGVVSPRHQGHRRAGYRFRDRHRHEPVPIRRPSHLLGRSVSAQ